MEISPSSVAPRSVVLEPKAQRIETFSDPSEKLSAQFNLQSYFCVRNLRDSHG
jgi:hypothetical protein